MAKRKAKHNVTVDTTTLKISEIIKQGKDAPLEHRIAAVTMMKARIDAIEAQVNEWKGAYEAVYNAISTNSYEDLKRQYEEESGETLGEDTDLEFTIISKTAGTFKVTLKGDTDKRFEIDAGLKAKATLDMVPDSYKTVSINLNKKAIEKAYDEGTLPDYIRKFCSSAPIDITKLRITAEKVKDDK